MNWKEQYIIVGNIFFGHPSNHFENRRNDRNPCQQATFMSIAIKSPLNYYGH